MASDVDEPNNPSRYLYDDGRASHPVIEYKVDRTETSGGSAIPSFVLDVTWPRVVVFYHAASPLCKGFKQKFVHLARETRHRSERVPLTFHAVSCSVHNDVCAEYNVKAVPVVMAFHSGHIDPMIVKRTHDNSIEPENLATILEIELREEPFKSENELEVEVGKQEALGKKLMSANFVTDSTGEERSDVAAAAALANEMLSLHASSSEVFTDASNAFMAALEFGTFEEFAKEKLLPAGRLNSLRQFLDLLHWSLPSKWSLHDLINDLRNDIGSVSRSHKDMMKVLHRHKPASNRPIWSKSCDRFNRGDINGGLDRQEGLQGFTCGFWRLLHISSIGVAEQHTSVMGDRSQVQPSYVAYVIRNYVEAYYVGSCMQCGQALIESVDECKYELCGRMAEIDVDTETKAPGWKDLAIWIWRAHNDVRQQEFSGTPWPNAQDCGGCQGALGWSLDDVYTHLKHYYWPSGVQNPRIVVLHKNGRLSRLHVQGSATWSSLGLVTLCCLILVTWFSWLRLRIQQSGLHKKSYLLNEQESKREKRSRSLRHRGGSSRYKSRRGVGARSRQQTTFLDS